MKVNKKVMGIGYILLASLTLFLMIETPYFSSIGEKICKNLGLKTLSNGTSGFNLMLVYAMPLIIVAAMGIRRYLYDAYPKTRKKGTLIVLGLTALFAFGSCGVLRASKSIQKNLQAVQYIADKSRSEFKIDKSEIVELKANIRLKNYSNTDLVCYIECYTDYVKDFTKKEKFLGYEMNEKTPKLLRIPAKSNITFEVDLKPNIDTYTHSKYSAGIGGISQIVLFNSHERMRFDGENLFGKREKLIEQ